MDLPRELGLVVARARQANIETSVEPIDDSNAADSVDGLHSAYVTLEIPNGRGTRAVDLSMRDVSEFLRVPFEKYSFVGDYEAIVHHETGDIQARVAPSEFSPAPISLATRRLMRLPGVVTGPEDVPGETEAGRLPAPTWSLSVPGDTHSLELGTPSGDLAAMTQTRLRFGVALSIRGQAFGGQSAAVGLLETISSSFFFDLDLRYGVMLTLMARRPAPARVRSRRPSVDRPAFPRMQYAAEPLSLYAYGRSASRLPLLEFLAYYQTLEYFFPSFSRIDSVRRVRRKLKDPRFDVMSDLDINEIISSSLGESTATRGERQQMRATVRACTEVVDLAAFISEQAELKESLCGKKRLIRGLNR